MIFRWFESLIDPFPSEEGNAPPTRPWSFYWHYLRQVRGVLAAVCFIGFFSTLIEVSLFQYIGKLIDLATSSSSSQSFFRDHGGILLVMAIVVIILRPMLLAAKDLLVNQALVPGLTARIRWQQHLHVVRQSLSFFHNDYSGRIAQRIMQTAASLRESAVQIVDAIWYVSIYTVSALALFSSADWRLTIPLVVWLIGYVSLLRWFVPRTRARSFAASQARSRVMGRVVDGYTNIASLKLFPQVQREDAYVQESVGEHLRKVQGMTRLTTGMSFSVVVLNGLLIVATTGLGMWLWSRAEISIGAVAFSAGLTIRITNISGWFMSVVNSIFENIGTVQDGMDTVSRPHTVVDVPDARPLRVARGEVRFENVEFHYGKRNKVISGLNLEVRPGEKLGLVGSSGAGKSTLVSLLLRLYDLQGGRVLIDGQDISAVPQVDLRGQIGVVTQDTSLLHRSIRENLLYGRPDASEEELRQAVRSANADGFIPQLVDSEGRVGMDAVVGERGVKLSGGQRQRIAIARVLLKNAPILVLDEATSALDSEVEFAIQESLDVLMRGKTVIAIAHRLSTIARMDRLVVMDQGRIVETGTHSELIARDGLYSRLWARQTGGFVAIGA